MKLAATLMLAGSLVASAGIPQTGLKSLEGAPFDVNALSGKVVLFVNVASKCGFTRQYAGLQKLQDELHDQGLVIVGVPSNDFGGQEPGTSGEIAEFCKTNYGVTFPITEKITVKGPSKHPLYTWLTTGRGEPKWNFHKYLVNKQGDVVAEFPSSITPENAELRAAIEKALSGS